MFGLPVDAVVCGLLLNSVVFTYLIFICVCVDVVSMFGYWLLFGCFV